MIANSDAKSIKRLRNLTPSSVPSGLPVSDDGGVVYDYNQPQGYDGDDDDD